MPVVDLQSLLSHPQFEEKLFLSQMLQICGDRCLTGWHRPAMSKHQLLDYWPKPEFVWDVASFIGFVKFYSFPC
jgi:hypothetical protein